MCAHREAAYPPGTWVCGVCRADPCTHLATGERIQDSGVILPLFHDLAPADQDRVIAALAAAVQCC